MIPFINAIRPLANARVSKHLARSPGISRRDAPVTDSAIRKTTFPGGFAASPAKAGTLSQGACRSGRRGHVLLSVLMMLAVSWRASAATAEPQTTEQQWIVQSILEDIARMTLFAGKQAIPAETAPLVKVVEKPADAQGSHFTATVQWPGEAALEQAVELPVHIWNVDGYAKVAAGFLEKRKLAAETKVTAPAGGALKSLTAYDSASLEKENLRLSKWVTEHPLDAEAHAQAALLVAVFASREASGAFYDTRGALNRATAHLALAQALRKGAAASDSAAVAALLLSLQTARQNDTEAALKALEPRAAKQPELAPWLLAAKMRERKNWRLLKDFAKATHLERVEYYRAYEAAISSEAVAKDLQERQPELTADWPRIVLNGSFAVPTGHQFAPVAVALEFKEIATVFPEIAGKEPAKDTAKLVRVLNQIPRGAVAQRLGPKPTVEIIDRGAWALHFQRHLCHAIHQTHYFLESLWGVPDEAAQMRQSCDQAFSKLWLYPLATLGGKNASWIKGNTAGLVSLVGLHPEWVEPHFWTIIQESSKDVAPVEKFYTPPLPEGTLYGYLSPDPKFSRWASLNELQKDIPGEFDRLTELAPWNRVIVDSVVRGRSGGRPSPEQVLKAMAPFLDYDLQAMNACARAAYGEPEVWLRIMRQGAAFQPGNYINIMNYLRTHQREAEAAEAYEEARAKGADPITVANNSEWVVNYYYDHDQEDKANKAAVFAGDVYSYRGLATLANLRERQGRHQEAEEGFGKVAERYNDTGELVAFYRRHGGDKPGTIYAKKFETLTHDVFPKGIQKARFEDFRDPPLQGVLVASENNATRHAGLQLNDVIVALNGDRTDTFEQYSMVRRFDTKPDMHLILFRPGTGYMELKCEQERRVFGVDFQTYGGQGAQPAKPAKRPK